jgi:hypothetical protein
MKTLIGLLPIAAALGVAAAAIWLMVERNIAAGAWLLAALLIGHGLVHGLYLVPQDPSATGWPFDMARSWLVTWLGIDAAAARAVGTVLIAAIAVGFALGGLATLDLLVPSGWWPNLVLGSTLASVLLLVLFFDPQLVLGLAIDGALLWIVLASTWRPMAA